MAEKKEKEIKIEEIEKLQKDIEKLTTVSLSYKKDREIEQLVTAFKISSIEKAVKEIAPEKAEEIMKKYKEILESSNNSLVL